MIGTVSAQFPTVVVVKPLGGDLGMEPVGGYGDPGDGGQHEITIGAVDDGIAYELDRYCVLQGAVALISPCPLLREPLYLAGRITGRYELHPVRASWQLVSEGMQCRCPRDGRL
jgi:hypothetical protein